MFRKNICWSVLSAAGILFGASAQAHPAFVVAGQSLDSGERAMTDGLLFEHDGVKVMRRIGAKVNHFQKLYWVNIDGASMPKESLVRYGRIEHLQPGKFAIMQLEPKMVEDLSGHLHHSGMACGVVFKLHGDVVTSKRRSPDPIVNESTTLAQVQTAIAMVDQTKIRATVEQLAEIETRYYNTPTGVGVADMLTDLYTAHAGSRDDVQIMTYEHSSLPQASLLVRIVGSERPDEIIVLGSHIDSVNSQDGSRNRAPGADDNASGTATNLEIFRVLMEQNFRPQRTVEIHGYAAEEIGLDGSQDMARQYAADGKNVVAMVQHDMNLYSDTGTDKIWFVANNTSSELNNRLIGLLTNYLSVEHETGYLFGGNSDHYSWTRNGYHAAFPFENPGAYNRKIHTRDDTIANAPRFSQAAEFAKLGVAYVVHFAGEAGK